jgi:LysM repeat protein/TolA-binding protein
MPVFKDDELACEILSKRNHIPQTGSSKTILIFAAAGAALVVAVVAIFSHRTPARLASVSPAEPHNVPAIPAAAPAPAVPAAASVTQATQAPVPAPAAAKVEAPKAAEVVVLPPVTLKEQRQPAAATQPIAGSDLSARLTFARSTLNSGKASEAIELVKTHLQNFPNAGADEKAEAAVLEGRALLAQGKVADAKLKFEPLALTTSSNETGADALLGNFWCQAGSLARCRDSELEQVRAAGTNSWGGAIAGMEEARRAEEKANGSVTQLETARQLYQEALESSRLDDPTVVQCVAKLTELTNKLILDPKVACTAPKAVFHKVESGDSAEKVARKYKVNIGQVKRINHLNDKLVVRLGQNLKMLPGEVVYKVDRTKLTGTLYIDNIFIRRYPVGIGPGNATPVGTFHVENKVMNPDWWYDGKRIPFGEPGNILGTRWMGFSLSDNDGKGGGLGVHGTALPDSVPGRESKGCVRMKNSDVEELYDLMPQGGTVVISD